MSVRVGIRLYQTTLLYQRPQFPKSSSILQESKSHLGCKQTSIRSFSRSAGNIQQIKNKINEAYEKYVPKPMKKVMTQIQTGTSAEFSNAKTYWRFRGQGSLGEVATYNEMMAVSNFRRDGIKSISVLFLAVVPMGFWLLWVPIVVFPRRLFPRSFWTELQKKSFYRENHLERLDQHRIVMHHFDYQKNFNLIKGPSKDVITSIHKDFQSKGVLRNQDLMAFRQVCGEHPFSLDNSNVVLVRAFCKVFEVNSYGPLSMLSQRLRSKAHDIMDMDLKLAKMNLDKLTTEQIMDANYLRGLNTSDLSRQANLYWLKNWLDLSNQCSKDDPWFLLHAMVFHSINFTELKFQRSAFS